MKPFNLEEAKAGKPICTRNGDKARIICTDLKCLDYHIIAAVWDSIGEQEDVLAYTDKGEHCEGTSSEFDLMMVEYEEPKCPFKPFDKVLMRYEEDDRFSEEWVAQFFESYAPKSKDEFRFCSMNYIWFAQCIPYNEETEHLIGTNDDAPDKYVIW